MKNLTLVAIFTVSVLVLTGCGLSGATSQRTQPSSAASEAVTVIPDCEKLVVKQEGGDALTKPRRPVRIAVFQDKSYSANQTRTAQITETDFDVPIKLLRCTGGELSAGIVDDVSNSSLLRLRVDVPPAPPSPPEASNVFERAEQDGDYQKRLNQYNDHVRKWTAETDKQVQTFLSGVRELLTQKPTAKRTDVWSAVARGDLFLAESDATWPLPTSRWLILNSDAVHTARSKPVKMKSSARLIVVNGVGSAGVAGSLNPELFEAIGPAFQFIAAKELGGKL